MNNDDNFIIRHSWIRLTVNDITNAIMNFIEYFAQQSVEIKAENPRFSDALHSLSNHLHNLKVELARSDYKFEVESNSIAINRKLTECLNLAIDPSLGLTVDTSKDTGPLKYSLQFMAACEHKHKIEKEDTNTYGFLDIRKLLEFIGKIKDTTNNMMPLKKLNSKILAASFIFTLVICAPKDELIENCATAILSAIIESSLASDNQDSQNITINNSEDNITYNIIVNTNINIVSNTQNETEEKYIDFICSASTH